MASTTPVPAARDARLWALAAGNFGIGTGALVVSGLLPPMAADLGRSYAAVGQAVTAFALSVAIFGPLLAGIASRFDRRRVLEVGLALFIVGNLLGALAPGYAWLLISRCIAGVGAALFTPHAAVATSLMVDPQMRGRALSLVFTGFTASTVLGVPIGTVAGDILGWRATLAAIAAFSLIALFAIRRLLPGDLRAPAIDADAWLQVLRSRPILLLLLVTLVQSTGQFVLLSYIAPALHATINATSTMLGIMFIVYGCFGVLGNVLGGALVDTYGAARVMNGMVISVGAGLALFPLSALGVAATAVVMAIWGFGSFAINGTQQPRLIGRGPELASATLPLNSSAIYVGQAMGAALGGIVLTHQGTGPLAPIGAVVLALALGLSIAAEHMRR